MENQAQEPMLIQKVDLLSSSEYCVNLLEPLGRVSDAQGAAPRSAGPLAGYIDELKLLSKQGDAHSFLFQLEKVGPPPSKATTPGAPDVLGRVEIVWRCVGGDQGRLLTQAIAAPASPPKDAYLELAEFPSKIRLYSPFEVMFKVYSLTESRLGPLKVSFNQSLVSSGNSHHQDNIVMDGPQSVSIQELPPNGSASVKAKLFPKASGRSFIQKFLLTDDRDGRVLDTLQPFEVFVHETPEE